MGIYKQPSQDRKREKHRTSQTERSRSENKRNKNGRIHGHQERPRGLEKCKILGSLLDTNEDIKRIKQLANNAVRKLQHIFNNNRLNIKTKVRIVNACVESIFLYNSELWTLKKTAENKIDSYHRRLLRRAINIRWPDKISCVRPLQQNKTGKMEWKNQDSENEMVRSRHQTT